MRGKGGKERVVPLGEEAAYWLAPYLRDGAASARARRCDALFLSARGRRLDTSTLRRSSQPPPPAARVRDAPARGRRRPAHDPGAARPRVAVDDADLQPRRRPAPAARLRPSAPALVVSAGGQPPNRVSCRARSPTPTSTASCSCSPRRRSPRTVDAYRRDLAVARRLPRRAGRRRVDVEELERWVAADAARTGSPPRRSRAAPPPCASFFRHQPLIGGAPDNPAAELSLPRRPRRLPRTLSPAETERLIEAANGVTPRGAARPRARRAALRRGAARLRGRRPRRARPSTSTSRIVRVARQGRQGADRAARAARPPRRCAATSRSAGRTSTGATGPTSSSTPAAAR